MPKPSNDEIEIAIAEAIRLREAGEDEFFLAKVVLNHNHRLKLLDEVYKAANSYLHGSSTQQHSRLIKAIEAYRTYDTAPG